MRHLLPSILLTATLSACGSDSSEPTAADDDVDARVVEPAAVPATAAELFAFLQAGSYLDFVTESGPHSSAGPHGGTVRSYLNPVLAASLASGGPHPVGAAAVKELYDDGTLSGWAVEVKIAAGETGDAWYWYEVFNTTSNTGTIQGIGVPLCANCHADGTDFVLTRYPLQ
jgi:hypothetical protein